LLFLRCKLSSKRDDEEDFTDEMDDATETRRRSPRAVGVVFSIILRSRKGTKRFNDE
jgi:hypothetical protein